MLWEDLGKRTSEANNSIFMPNFLKGRRHYVKLANSLHETHVHVFGVSVSVVSKKPVWHLVPKLILKKKREKLINNNTILNDKSIRMCQRKKRIRKLVCVITVSTGVCSFCKILAGKPL